MGTLVAMRYPTSIALGFADHTYVKCSTGGKAWGCWGGNTGGNELVRGGGSTRRAGAIAGKNERAGITCYLINGVCHQAANRILLPARRLVLGARGYWISEALFGTYGRPRGPLGLCRAPFRRHLNVTGDLPECVDNPGPRSAAARKRSLRAKAADRRERSYVKRVLQLYKKAGPMLLSRRADVGWDLEDFGVELFAHQARYRLGDRLDGSTSDRLEDVRRSAERSRLKIEEWYHAGELQPLEFVEAFNRETLAFQYAVAGALDAARYKALFGLSRDQTVTLADPRIVRRVFPEK